MHNWWIASLEHFGLITHEEGEHLANNIKNSIHRDNYDDAVKSLEAILGSATSESTPIVRQLKIDLVEAETKIKELQDLYTGLEHKTGAAKQAVNVTGPIGTTPAPSPPSTEVKKTVAKPKEA